jgi:HAD superfamily hydrolase (TIGR01509 family)
MNSAAVLLDVDGTLVDTSYLHALAWFRAFRHAGHLRPVAELHRLVGLAPGLLVETVVGERRDELVDAWEHELDRLKRDITVFPGAVALVGALSARGVQVVLVTSGRPRDVRQLRELLAVDHAVAAVADAAEVEAPPPAPDQLRLALERVGVAPEQAVMVGDTVWDMRAARALGVPAVAVLTGGAGEVDLREEGAVAVYRSVDELASNLAYSPVAALWAS